MDSEQTLKILKMVQEGFLTPEQGQRLIQELVDASAGNAEGATREAPRDLPKDDSARGTSGSQEPDLFHLLDEAGKTFTQGFERLFSFASQTVKDGMGLGPQNVVLKVLDLEDGKERYQVTIPLKIFTALKPLLTSRPPMVVHPIQSIDYEALFRSLESGETGKVFEYLDHAKGDRFEVWVL